MKIPYRQLSSELGRGLAAVYLVAGDEPLLVDEALEAVRERARSEGFAERELHVVDRSFRWAELGASADAMSLFATRRIVELRLHSMRIGDGGGQAIKALLERPDPDRILLVGHAGKVDASAVRTSWVRLIETAGVRVEIWPVARKDLPPWLAARAERHGLRLARSAIAALADRAEGNLLAADQALIKLRLQFGAADITEAEVIAAEADSARYDVFALSDAMLAGDGSRAMRILNGLSHDGTAPALVAWTLIREISQLAQLQSLAEGSGNLATTLRSQGVWPRRQPLIQAALRRLDARALRALTQHASALDRDVKGAGIVGPWESITDFLLHAVTGRSLVNHGRYG